ncbi:hypothetical protein [Pseudonocardia sp.]|jgi:hypothetical protein|uniref:hypothetical protein n=1 Tax=Pseudonocardia sp. TaxID=60912 RepID=UPI002D85A3F2|nr:hypothetical protein [Pseudonocardia sp.]
MSLLPKPVVAMPTAAASPGDGVAAARSRRDPVARAGRHRRATTPRTLLGLAVDVVGRVGSLVTLAALVVLAATAGAMADGMPAGGSATVTATFDRSGP